MKIGYCECCEKHRQLSLVRGRWGDECWACWECLGEDEDPYGDDEEDDWEWSSIGEGVRRFNRSRP